MGRFRQDQKDRWREGVLDPECSCRKDPDDKTLEFGLEEHTQQKGKVLLRPGFYFRETGFNVVQRWVEEWLDADLLSV